MVSGRNLKFPTGPNSGIGKHHLKHRSLVRSSIWWFWEICALIHREWMDVTWESHSKKEMKNKVCMKPTHQMSFISTSNLAPCAKCPSQTSTSTVEGRWNRNPIRWFLPSEIIRPWSFQETKTFGRRLSDLIQPHPAAQADRKTPCSSSIHFVMINSIQNNFSHETLSIDTQQHVSVSKQNMEKITKTIQNPTKLHWYNIIHFLKPY